LRKLKLQNTRHVTLIMQF